MRSATDCRVSASVFGQRTSRLALLRRIEQLERSSDDKEPMQESAAANPSLREIASVRPQRPNLAPWFRLKR